MPCRKIHAGRPQTSAELRSTTPYLLALMQCVVLQMEQYWLAIHPSLRQHLAVQPQEVVHVQQLQLERSKLVLELRAGPLALVLTLSAADQDSDASRVPVGRGCVQRATGIW